ncbi:hypothetical protein JJQ72_02420 [Paenibacillus sp. F411]|uniref:hypothetical protein n=1 Tax=Paenibacillus sp. F411 TaxID=2820239 RepID=UPI001AAF256B|nr:hypothetical protein [Paenibacillus sp. F411]MBO2942831.1 hypothetical protein [Paenibacillus sp. F411]
MFRLIISEFKQLTRKPIWLFIFAVTIVVSIFLPRSSITHLTVIPGMVYFIMIMSLLLSIYGAESARADKTYQVDETLSVTPLYRKYFMAKLIYWLMLSAFIYVLFYAAVLSYIGLIHSNITSEDVYRSLVYTLLVWFIPFFFSILIGYIIYSWLPSFYSYLFIVVIWFLTMPYNSMIGLIPRNWSGWIINGDPNIIQIFSTNPLESLEINRGYFIQRIFMFLILFSGYLLAKYKIQTKIRITAALLLVISVLLPLFSPYVPYITGGNSLSSSSVIFPENKGQSQSGYRITKYIFHLNHGQSNHELKYTVNVEIEAEQDDIEFALLDDFKINSIHMNNKAVVVSRSGNLVKLQIPEKTGILQMDIETDSFIPIGPSTIQLVATTAWYPMIPDEARDPYNNAIKEQYEVHWEPANHKQIKSNLQRLSRSHWSGTAYGPTFLMGRFTEVDNVIFPKYQTAEKTERINRGLAEIFDNNNKKYNKSEQLPPYVYYVSTFYGMQANPDEAYVYPNVFPNQEILNLFYLKKGEE